MEGLMSRGHASTYRFEESHPPIIEGGRSPSDERAESPSIFTRLFRSGDGIFADVSCARREREEPPMTTAQQCRLLAAQARVKAMAVSADESDAYVAIAREYEAIAAAMEVAQGDGPDDQSISAPSSKNG
jgi:hypothetical protein